MGSITGLAAGTIVSAILLARSRHFCVAAPLEMIPPHPVKVAERRYPIEESWPPGTNHFQRKPDQSSATRIESTGLEGSYLTLAGWPGTRRSSRTWLSSPVMS